MLDIATVESVLQLAHTMKQQLGHQLEVQKLAVSPMHVRVMMAIQKHKTCTAQDITSILKRDKAQITRLINRLIDQELVQKEPNPEDKRSQLLALTAQGVALQESLFGFAGATQKKIVKGITADDLNAFIRVAQKMTQNLTR